MLKILRAVRDFLDRYKLLPAFTEDTVFLMLVALGIIYFVDPSSQKDIYETLRSSTKLTLITVVGATFTLYTAFFTRFKTETQKHYMLWFALIINLVVGITALTAINEQGDSFLLLLFPLINIATFFIVIIFWYAGLYTTGKLATKSNSYTSMIYGSLAIIFISFVYKFFSGANWQVIFSTSVAYAALLNTTVVQHLPKIFPNKGNKIEITQKLIDQATEQGLMIINTTNTGLKKDHLIITTESDTAIQEIPENQWGKSDEYIASLISSQYQEKNVATTMLGYYDWKSSWWSKTKTYPVLVIDVFLAREPKRYEFYQTLEEFSGEFKVSERGLIYQQSHPRY